jgi:hydroxymethylbilane synthase
MAAALPDGLTIASVLPREIPLDAIVLPAMANGSVLIAKRTAGHQPFTIRHQPSAMTLEGLVTVLGPSASIGTGSVRRIAQLSRVFPGARFTGIRGNLDTRLRKLDEGAHDALVLAAAGLTRLGYGSRISLAIPADACVPAPGQGIVAIEIRTDDARTRDAVARVSDADAADALAAERAVVATLGGGCQMPLGALATITGGDRLELNAVVMSLDGRDRVSGKAHAPRHEAAALGERVGAQLLADGAAEILAQAQGGT